MKLPVDPYPLVYVGLTNGGAGGVVAQLRHGDREPWLFSITALEARIHNRKNLKLGVIEEEKALSALKERLGI